MTGEPFPLHRRSPEDMADRYMTEIIRLTAALEQVRQWAYGRLPGGRSWPGNSADVYREAQTDVRLILLRQPDPS